MARPGGYFRTQQAAKPKKRPAPVRPAPEVSVQAPRSAAPRAPQKAQTVFSAPIGTVHPAGGSAAQRTARGNTRNQSYRQQIIATRQIQQRQQPRILANPRQDAFQVQERQRRQQQANVRAQHIAIQQVHMVQDQVQNPARANRVLAGQTYQKLREVADIGRLSKIAGSTKVPLQHRVGALRSLRSRYGIPVTQENFKQFRQAQAFHSFLHDGKEGDTFAVPTNQKGPGLHRVSQTYQLRKVKGSLQPVAVDKRPILSLGGALQGHPYKDQYVPSITAREGIAAQSGGIGRGFVQAGVDTAHFGAKAIPEGKVGTPVRRAVTELAALGPNTITGIYGLGAAGVAAAGGNTKPIRDIAKSFSEDDPLGRLVTHGDFKAFAQHPGIAIAEVFGGVTALDRAAGRVARRGAPPSVRSTRRVIGTNLARQDRYSKGLLVSRRQQARDAKLDAKFHDLRNQAVQEVNKAKAAQARGDGDATSGHLHKAQQLAAQAEKYNRSRVREGYDIGSPHRNQGRGDVERLADVTEGTNQFAQRKGRAEAIRGLAGQKAVREKNRRPGVVAKDEAVAEVQGLVSEMRVAPNRGELAKVANRLEQQAQHLADHGQIATNRSVVRSIRQVLATHTDDQLRLLGDEARRYAGVNVAAHDLAKSVDLGTHDEFAMSAAKPFAVEQMGARPNADGKLAVTRNGQEHILTLDEIHKAANAYADRHPGALRPGEQAFISHSSRAKGPGAFNMRADKAMGLSRARRTGAAVVYGTASVGRDAMVGSVVKLRNMATQVQSFRHMLGEAAGRDPARIDHASGRVGIIQEKTPKDALKKWNELGTDQATGLPKAGFVEGIAIRTNPLGGRAEQMARTLHDVDEEGFAVGDTQPVVQAIQDALEGKDVGSGPWTVIPKPFADRLLDHSRVSGGASPFWRSVSSAFRKTVLPFSPTWITGNAIESLVRGSIAGWHPRDTEFENRVLTEWAKQDPERAARFLLSVGTGHFGSADIWKVRNTANSIKGGPLKPLHDLGEKILNAEHGGKQAEVVTDAVRAYTDWMMNSVNGTMESAIKRGMVGTQMRQLLPRDLPAKTEAAVKAVAGELHSNPAAVEELLSRVQRAYGTYEHQSPEMRRTIINFTPFGAWVFNAVTFLTRVLPADHPGLVAVLAANDSATRQYRRANGLDATLADEKNAGQRPPFLMGSIPTPAWYARLVGAHPGDPLRLARYTPFGIATDPTSTLGSMFLPQIPLEILQGYDFAGRPLRNSDGSSYDQSQLVEHFALNFAMGTIPLFGQIARGFQKGPLSVVNPLTPVASKPKKSSGSSGGGLPAWGGSGGSSGGGGLPTW